MIKLILKILFYGTLSVVLLSFTISLISPKDTSSSSTDSSAAAIAEAGDELPNFNSQECLVVSAYLLNGIGEGFPDSTLTGKAAGYASTDFTNVKFVALEFIPTGEVEPLVAIVATNDDDLSDDTQEGLIFSADGYAKNFSQWGSPESLELSHLSAGAQEAVQCLAAVE